MGDEDARFIWATRGRSWGFRFLRRGGFADPLPIYDAAFAEIGDQSEAWGRVADKVALRFPDPGGREDASGRTIPHEFVLFGPMAEGIDSLGEGRQRVWREVADEYEGIWDAPDPPRA